MKKKKKGNSDSRYQLSGQGGLQYIPWLASYLTGDPVRNGLETDDSVGLERLLAPAGWAYLGGIACFRLAARIHFYAARRQEAKEDAIQWKCRAACFYAYSLTG